MGACLGRSRLVSLSLFLAGCLQGVVTTSTGTGGGSTTGSPGTTTGGCQAAGGGCNNSADCCDESPCCTNYVHASCGAVPAAPPPYCLCTHGSDCSFFLDSSECVPRVISSGKLTGPYVCVNNDGQFYDGCRGFPCSVAGQSCAIDQAGNRFCSVSCTSDSSCNNPGVACCNAPCQDGGKCCGLCGS